ncbi:FtsQ-type POTRA domain-containing protein [Nanchangia anserum]|uniref:FtsQ-type POTRA domain-containing protein n=1 Tax=Nanchangia anserum TaxID=2692125 RepID=A0A8I0GG78_9ACTO|nr:cell division protein FtsQ/DivIB [Nanchangia anserum]MBD3690237.1 FtsQ-type POTRA domain-containing protein [Nanchangia anserum]QOX82320.1 FtsQ-type POTRA domain-containing protein [Nanchangia anserum]
MARRPPTPRTMRDGGGSETPNRPSRDAQERLRPQSSHAAAGQTRSGGSAFRRSGQAGARRRPVPNPADSQATEQLDLAAAHEQASATNAATVSASTSIRRPPRDGARRLVSRFRRSSAPAARASASAAQAGADHRRADSVVSTSLEVKLRERARKRRRLVWRAWSIAAAVVLVAALAWGIAGFSPLFAVRASDITIRGVSAPVEATAVTKVVHTAVGTPLPRVDTGELADMLTRDQPWVSGVDIDRSYPHGLTVVVHVRRAVARNADSTTQLVSADGAIVPASGTAAEGLPSLVVADTSSARQSRRDGARIAALLDDDTRAKVRSITIDDKNRVTMSLDSQASVRWGTVDDSELKARVLATLIQRQAKVYDLTDPLNPTTR